jgi:ABC-type multidrug transport system fused ATPase/permease subunit
MLGLFAASAFRILPSLNKIIAATQTIRSSLPVINTLYDEFRLFDLDRKQQEYVGIDEFNGDIVFDDVTFQYPDTSAASLAEISLKIGKGSSVGIIGGSGEGKRTLVDIMLGLFAPTNGVVSVNGIDIGVSLRQWQNQIGYVPQSIYLTDDTLRRNVAFGVTDHQIDDAAVWKVLRAAHLDDFVNDFPDGLDTMVGERGVKLSGGQRQRIGIARALYHNPAVLVLDEATSALETFTEHSVMDAIRSLKGNKTVVIVAHRLSTVEHCDYVYRLEKGRVVEEGATARVLDGYR